jgi:phage repressor protein C with HTH and peptisase S24 domain
MFYLKDLLPKIKDIISKELGNRKVYDKDVAVALNINQPTFTTMKNRGKIPYQEILDFCATRKISINWLFYDQITKSLEEETERYANVRYFSGIYASAGGGAMNYDDEFEELVLDDQIVQKLGGKTAIKNIDSLNVLGDSMEPTFRDGDIVFVNRTIKDIQKGGIFVLSTPVGLFVKRLRLKIDGTVEMMSDNPSYPTELIDMSGVELIGKVVGSMNEF